MNSKHPFVSLCTINYNGFDLTKECIESLLQTRYSKFEVIVVDNQSTDNSFKKLKTFFKKESKVRFAKAKENGYVTGGYNEGASIAKGDYFVFLNNDVTVEPNWLLELMKCATPNRILQPKVLSYWDHKIIDNTGGFIRWPLFGDPRGMGDLDKGQYDSNEKIDYAHATIFLFSKKTFIKLGGLDGWFKTHYEDVDIGLRAKKIGVYGYYCYKSVTYHKGSWTYKHKTPSQILVYHVRKNRIRTIIKNFTGPDKILRLSGTLLIYAFFVIKDLLLFRVNSATATIKAVRDAVLI